jgi:hypothetical protein
MNMDRDFEVPDPSGRPAFFYHLGDVVYYYGEASEYYPQFYEPYVHYPAPIFAIPGNHDGDLPPQPGDAQSQPSQPSTQEPTQQVQSLDAFVRNFCADAPQDAAVSPLRLFCFCQRKEIGRKGQRDGKSCYAGSRAIEQQTGCPSGEEEGTNHSPG